MIEEPDDVLIGRCRRGDRDAWLQIVERYQRLVYSIPLSYRLSPADAADIAQLTFTILIESLDRLEEGSRLGPWLATVARRHTWRLIERSRRETVGADDDLASSFELEAVGNPQERWERMIWLDSGLSRLSEPCRMLLQLLYFSPEEPSYQQVADRLGLAVGSIGPTRARCLDRLRRLLGEE